MFRAFPDTMLWSQATLHAVNSGGDINEIERAIAPLRDLNAPDKAAWSRSWAAVGEDVLDKARSDLCTGHLVSARRKLQRAAVYLLSAERMLEPEDTDKAALYARMREAMRLYVDVADDVENAAVPFEDTTLPAYFLRGRGGGPRPTVVVIDGFDITRELMLFRMGPAAVARGLSLLVVDTPGVGEALRLQDLTARVDTETAVSACVDHLVARDDVDASALGLVGVSLGGYYAGRAAAFEHRIRATVLWGAIWNAGDSFRRIYAGGEGGRPAPPGQLRWVTGRGSVDTGLEFMDRLTLEEVAATIEGRLLVLHGAEDHLIPPTDAERVAAAATAAEVTLHIRTAAESGSQHCQVDSMPEALDEVFDFLTDALGR